jgi:hypothetical protein
VVGQYVGSRTPNDMAAFMRTWVDVETEAAAHQGQQAHAADDNRALTWMVAGVLIALFVVLSASIAVCSHYDDSEPEEVCNAGVCRARRPVRRG